MMAQQEHRDQQERRKELQLLLTSLLYLLKQGLAIGGHKENEGNLYELLKLRLKAIREPGASDAFQIERSHYMSPPVINELISLIGHDILRGIVFDIQRGQWFSVLGDETTDIANKEQFGVSIRCVDEKYEIHEECLGFFQVPNITGATLTMTLKDVLTRINLPLELCRGQAYDGAANMLGKWKGLATAIRKEEARAIPIHCLAHCLNLCLQDIG